MYVKFRFYTPGRGATAGLILECDAKGRLVDPHGSPYTLQSISRLYPMSEAGKMERCETSPAFETWKGAFEYQFGSVV